MQINGPTLPLCVEAARASLLPSTLRKQHHGMMCLCDAFGQSCLQPHVLRPGDHISSSGGPEAWGMALAPIPFPCVVHRPAKRMASGHSLSCCPDF